MSPIETARALPSSGLRSNGFGPSLAAYTARSLSDMRSRRESAVWELNSYQYFLSENAGRHHVIGSALVILAAAALLLIAFA
jgi:hypothetical protein